jgi:pimeloyl-ACP methyl ester carboxylesterase
MWMAETFGVNVVTYDYRGYGHSCPGDGTETDLCDFINAVLDDIGRHRDPENALILVGKSLGSVPTMYLAAHQHSKVDGVVIISGLATGARAFLHTPLIPNWIKKKFDDVFGNNIKQERMVDCQVFIIHGTEDSIIPVQNAHLLLANMSTNAYWPPSSSKQGTTTLS